MNTLYQALAQHLTPHLPLDWSAAVRERLLGWLVGIIHAQNIRPSQVAQALHELGWSQAQPDSIERRLRRIANDARLTPEACLHPLARQHLQQVNAQRLVLAIDASTHTDRMVVLMVGVCYRGQCLPLAWESWEANVRLKEAGFWQRVDALLSQVAKLLPTDKACVWLADRAFGTPKFTDLVQARGWHFVVRVQGQTLFRDDVGHTSRLDRTLTLRKRFKGRGQVFKKAKWRGLSVVVVKGQQHPSPLCLVSDLPPDWSLIRDYRQRFMLEVTFRLYKSGGWQWEASQVQALPHLQHQLLGMALATWMVLLTGSQVASEYLARPPSGQRRTRPAPAKHSLFSMGLSRLRAWLVGNTRGALGSVFHHWEAPAWNRQFHSLHTRAFVMGTLYSLVKVHH